ncbi:TonB family protein, partial [Pseudochelatococcus sp. B33]
ISDQMQNAVEAKSDTREPVEQPTEAVEPPTPEDVQPEEPVEEMAEPEPVETTTPEPLPEPDIEPLEEQVLPMVEKVEVPIPVARPRPVEKKPVEKPKPAPKKKELAKRPKREKPAPASKAAAEAASQVAQSNRNAASQASAGMGFGSVSPARWQSRLMAHLERRKRYPAGARSRGEQGTAYVRFRIDDNGNVLSASLARSSGYPELDAEVVELVRRASPVPAPPPEANRTITAPVRFTSR